MKPCGKATISPASRRPYDSATAWLSRFMDSPKPAKLVQEAADAEGISKTTLNRAKEKLGVQSEQKWDGERASWEWFIPLLGTAA